MPFRGTTELVVLSIYALLVRYFLGDVDDSYLGR